MRRRLLLAAASTWLAAPCVRAQPWPAHAIRIVVPFPPGGAADTVPRGIAQRLQASLGVPCVIENRPGAAGTIATERVASAPPDGYVLLAHVSSIAIQPHLRPGSYDLLADLVPVTQTVVGSYVLVVRPDFPADDLPGLLEEVRRAPGRYSYGSFGSGSGPHLAMELLKAHADLSIVHVPFRGAAPMLKELLSNRLDMAFDTTFAALPHIRAGKLKAIAVGGPRALDALPGVAPVAELVPGFDTDGWQGLFAPAGTPPAVVERLAREVAAALHDPELERGIAELGFRTVGNSPQAFRAIVAADHAKWGRVIRDRNILPD
jgi:tripartite-type tricarboxylate transporter receptor subunit TctC